MHLYIGVYIRELGPDSWQAGSPDLPHVTATAHTSGEALARIHLALEVDIAAQLGRGDALPRVRGVAELEAEAPAGERCFEVHINLRHLQALANHQHGRWN